MSAAEKLSDFLMSLSDAELLELLADGRITPNQARAASTRAKPVPPPPEPTMVVKGGFPRPFWLK